MTKSDGCQAADSHPRSSFTTTRWPLVEAAGERRGPDAHEALATLCEIYWYPLYAFLRRRGYDRCAAEDLTQGFFTFLLENDRLQAADRERGRFRSFLLASLKNYIANEWHRERALKRGGGRPLLSLDFEAADGQYKIEPLEDLTPEAIFDRRWALTQFDRAISRLEEEMTSAGKGERFRRLKGYLTGDSRGIRYARVAEELGVSKTSVKVSVYRLRRRLGKLLREEISRTLEDDHEVEKELRYLLSVLDA